MDPHSCLRGALGMARILTAYVGGNETIADLVGRPSAPTSCSFNVARRWDPKLGWLGPTLAWLVLLVTGNRGPDPGSSII